MRSLLLLAVSACGRIGFGTDAATGGDGRPTGDGRPPDDGKPPDVIAFGVVSFGDNGTETHTSVTADTVLIGTQPTLNYGVGATMFMSASSVGLLRFELTALPTSSTIVYARLRISSSESAITAQSIWPIRQAWDEGSKGGQAGEANWTNRQTAVAWSGAGASGLSRGATPIAMVSFAANATTMVDLDTAAVQSWITDPSSNFGVVFTGNSGSIWCREAAVGKRPQLELGVAN